MREDFELYQDLKNNLESQNASMLEQGRLLKKIRDGRVYKKLGLNPTFKSFLSSPEIALTQSKAYSYIQIIEVYEQHLKLTEEDINQIPINRLSRLRGYLRALPPQQAREELDKLVPLSTLDFEQALVDRGITRPKSLRIKADEYVPDRQVIEFDPSQTSKVINLETKEVVWQATT